MQEHIDRLEAEFKAKEQKLERLRAQLNKEGTSIPEAAPKREIEAQIRQAEMEAGDALERYEEALNQRDRAPGT